MKKDIVIAIIAFCLLIFLMGRCAYKKMDVPNENREAGTKNKVIVTSVPQKPKGSYKIKSKPTETPQKKLMSPTQAPEPSGVDTRPFVDVN